MKTIKSYVRGLRKYRKVLDRSLAKISQEISRVDSGLAALGTGAGRPRKARKRRKMSKASRAKISAGMRKHHKEAAPEKA